MFSTLEKTKRWLVTIKISMGWISVENKNKSKSSMDSFLWRRYASSFFYWERRCTRIHWIPCPWRSYFTKFTPAIYFCDLWIPYSAFSLITDELSISDVHILGNLMILLFQEESESRFRQMYYIQLLITEYALQTTTTLHVTVRLSSYWFSNFVWSPFSTLRQSMRI